MGQEKVFFGVGAGSQRLAESAEGLQERPRAVAAAAPKVVEMKPSAEKAKAEIEEKEEGEKEALETIKANEISPKKGAKKPRENEKA